ncbi:CoA transferase [Luminiphilus sp.]|nr:CaiB/BaiF CoA-transferase family protein [Luminiphilus sp.]MDA9711000.1 CoA transferase [Luminiphilus sp.]
MKLEGLTVLDLSLFLPGPAATQLMADHGARVIKVENPQAPEPTRSAAAFPWQQGGETVMFRNTQRGKESIALDLKTEAGKTALLALTRKVDVVVEAFRPGVAQRLGIDYASLSADNPGLVYCSISAFGQTGPWRDRPAHDTATVAAAGILDVTRSPEGDSGPAIIGVPIADMLSSYLALSGILMALNRRHLTGAGDFVDISMFESVLAASPNIMGPVFGGDRAPERLNERTHGGNAMLNVYETGDGQYLALGGGEHKFVEALFEGLGRPDFIPAVTGPAGEGHWEAIAFLRDTFRTRPRSEWEKWFSGRDICWSPVVSLHEAWRSEHVLERGMRFWDSDGNDHIGSAIKFTAEPAQIETKLPAMGEQTRQILDELDLTETDRKAILERL